MVNDVLIVSIVGGLLCLDRVFIQTMISRPVVSAPLVGLILGDPYTGLVSGAFIELFWIDRPAIGAYIPPNDTIAAVLIAAGAIESGRVIGELSQGLIAAAVLLYAPFAFLAKKMELRIIRSNEKSAKEMSWDADSRNVHSVAKSHFRAAMLNFVFPAAIILIALPAGIALITWMYPRIEPWGNRGLQLLYALLPVLGIAVTLNTIRLRGALPVFCGIFLAVTVIVRYM